MKTCGAMRWRQTSSRRGKAAQRLWRRSREVFRPAVRADAEAGFVFMSGCSLGLASMSGGVGASAAVSRRAWRGVRGSGRWRRAGTRRMRRWSPRAGAARSRDGVSGGRTAYRLFRCDLTIQETALPFFHSVLPFPFRRIYAGSRTRRLVTFESS